MNGFSQTNGKKTLDIFHFDALFFPQVGHPNKKQDSNVQ